MSIGLEIRRSREISLARLEYKKKQNRANKHCLTLHILSSYPGFPACQMKERETDRASACELKRKRVKQHLSVFLARRIQQIFTVSLMIYNSASPPFITVLQTDEKKKGFLLHFLFTYSIVCEAITRRIPYVS